MNPTGFALRFADHEHAFSLIIFARLANDGLLEPLFHFAQTILTDVRLSRNLVLIRILTTDKWVVLGASRLQILILTTPVELLTDCDRYTASITHLGFVKETHN